MIGGVGLVISVKFYLRKLSCYVYGVRCRKIPSPDILRSEQEVAQTQTFGLFIFSPKNCFTVRFVWRFVWYCTISNSSYSSCKSADELEDDLIDDKSSQQQLRIG
jgi:hypothetical protein